MTAVAARKGTSAVMPDRVGLAEHKRSDWVVDVEVGVSTDDILDPSFWSFVSKDFNPYDTIEVRADDGKWIAHLRVVSCERNYAKVQLRGPVEEIKHNADVPNASVKHKIEFKGAHLKHCVIRVSDSAVLQNGFKTRDEADVWLRSYERNA